MQHLTDKIKKEIKRHAIDESPDECCGVIYKEGKAHKSMRCENVAIDKKNNFRINPADYLQAARAGSVEAYYHSHTTDKVGRFSKADRKISNSHGIPLIMYCIKKNKFFEHND